MSAFKYRAVDAGGKEIGGVIEADTTRQARSLLRERGLFPVDVSAARDGVALPRGGRLSVADLTLLTRQWATLIDAGLTIEQSLTALIEQSELEQRGGNSAHVLLAGIRAEVTAGHALSAALARFPAVFPPIYRALVSAGEKSGELPQVLQRLADYLEARHAARQKVLQALLYPVLVTLVAGAVILGLLTYVVPQVVRVFDHGKQALPLLTRSLIGFSGLLQSWGPWLLLLLAAAVAALWRALRGEGPRRRAHGLLLRIPVLGRLLRSLESARFAQTLAILVSGGVPLLAALDAGREVLALLPLRDAAGNAIRLVREGGSLAAALGRDRQFPPLLVHLIASGEASGELGSLLERAARQQQDEVQARLALLLGLLEPLLILAMGGIVLLIVLAVLQPIIEINQLLR